MPDEGEWDDGMQQLSKDVAVLGAKIDAYANLMQTRVDAIEKRVDKHDTEIDEIKGLTTAAAAVAGMRIPGAGWKVAGVIIAGLALVGSSIGTMLAVVQAVAR